jgi:2-polyprenyl-6-hydroxyphenyl methylase/3-demethylubiquinone-9 3-methyltransferase
MTEQLNVDPAELARFEASASRWWDPDGAMRPLHDLNPVRLQYVERSAPLAGRTVVDVGCGGGLLSEAMAHQGASVVGLDLAADLLSVARLHALDAGVTVDYRLASAEQHAAEHAGRYDVVTAAGCLSKGHIPKEGLDDIHAALKIGGYFVSGWRTYYLTPGEENGFYEKLETMTQEGKFTLVSSYEF